MKIFALLTLLFYSSFLTAQAVTLEKAILDYTKENNFNGTILIQEKDTLLHSKSYGFANKEFQIPNRLNTRYKIASITKLFTSVLIYQLVEKGQIELDSPIQKHLPAYKGEGSNKVTIHQLLTSTSGIQNLEKSGDIVYEKRLTSQAVLDQYCSGSLEFTPGTKFSYNNADFIILGKILEKIYAQPFKKILNDQLLRPLQMTNTGMLNYQIVDNLAQCYWYNEDVKQLERDPPYYVENYYSSGAMYSSVTDLLTFSNSLYKHKILKKETLDILLKPENEILDKDNYASGLWVYKYKVSDKVQHTGASRQGNIWGAEAMLLKIFEKDITIIILSNSIGTSGMWDLVWKIKKAIYNA